MTRRSWFSELVVDSARARQLELEGFLREQVLELRPGAGQHLRVHPSDQRAVVALVQVRKAVLPGIGAEQLPLLLPVCPRPGKGHVARNREAPEGDLVGLVERRTEP